MSPRASRESGFSQIELLALGVSVTILVLLAVPLRAGGSMQARTALCLDNLRQLSAALTLYAIDQEWYPPNPDDGNTTDSHNWCPGTAGIGHAQEFDPDILKNPAKSLLARYLEGSAQVFRCPADPRKPGRYQGTNLLLRGTWTPAARSVSLNATVGTNPNVLRGKQPVDGPWLDNTHSHTYWKRWRTYGKPDQVVAPSPALLFTMIDEDEKSLNDAGLQNGMQAEEWIDYPATRHDTGGTIAFADGHVQIRRWTDPRTFVTANVSRRAAPGSPDVLWLRERTSAEIPR